jgi:hypothetical protein
LEQVVFLLSDGKLVLKNFFPCQPSKKQGRSNRLVSRFDQPTQKPKESLGNLWCPSGTGLIRDFAAEVPCPAGGKTERFASAHPGNKTNQIIPKKHKKSPNPNG